VLASRYIVLPAVPRASYDIAAKLALSQWTALVRAHSIQGENALLCLKERQNIALDQDFERLILLEIGLIRDVDPVFHKLPVFRMRCVSQ